LFTENYMVRFLLDNSLGAWWAARHPESSLVKTFEYLRFSEDGSPAAGSFDAWPDRVSKVTVMDPCCGSGHFLVEAFSMLWQMRVEEEGLRDVEAQDAVLRDNLFGLELDLRCVQIAMFAVALQAWKAGGAWRQLPVPNIACSGIPVKAPVEEWKRLAGGDERLENALVRLHILFRDADTLGSLIDLRRATEITEMSGLQRSLDDVEWNEIAPLLEMAVRAEANDPATAVLGADATGMVRAADYLSRQYRLVATNVPYLGRTGQGAILRGYLTSQFSFASEDLATAFAIRLLDLAADGGSIAVVLPETALFLGSQREFRRHLLRTTSARILALLGAGAFAGIGGEVVRVSLVVVSKQQVSGDSVLSTIDASKAPFTQKLAILGSEKALRYVSQAAMMRDRLFRMLPDIEFDAEPLRGVASSVEGMSTGDGARYQRNFWELSENNQDWVLFQRAPEVTQPYGGLDTLVLWEGGKGSLASDQSARVQGLHVWGRPGVLIERMSSLRAAIYAGGAFQKSTVVVRPKDDALLPAIWCFCEAGDHKEAVLGFERRIGIATSAIVDVAFNVEYWRRIAAERYPDGLPEPWSDDPTQWLFKGRPEVSTSPLQVAVARLVGYRWPEQRESDGLDRFADADGIVCVPSVAGEAPAADRVQQLLAAAYGERWSPSLVTKLLADAGSQRRSIADWVRDEFFKQHCAFFGNRPFVWHIWDGRRDGFSALVKYHRLDRKGLEKLTYTYLGTDWVERQRAEIREQVAGAEARLAAALELQRKLELILEGEAPFDIYVRWKSLAEQPIGWEPDLNDGVRLNIRPFVEAGVLRSPFNIHWRKDRGRNPDGSERHNDIHLALAEKTNKRTRTGAR
jgi:hypothetical protein